MIFRCAKPSPLDARLEQKSRPGNKRPLRTVWTLEANTSWRGAVSGNESDDLTEEGIGRRGLLKCMTWGGTGLIWSLSAGLPSSMLVDKALAATPTRPFTFMQISDSHIGFNKAANPHATDTLKEAVDRIVKLPRKPDFMIHTGDISHLSRPDQFDTAAQLIGSARVQTHYVPGEHDLIDENNGKLYLDRYGAGTKGAGWYAFDQNGVHFVGLNNVVDLKAGGLGNLGPEQIAWLADDLQSRPASTPIVVFAHIPLWTVYPDWGWGTNDGAQVLALLKRFGSVTILNGHIHQIVQKVEGTMAFHTARSTAFPQPAPGTAASPGPMTVPGEQLRSMLGLTRVDYVVGRERLAITDTTLANG
jgi:hypothetical protein